MIRRIRNIIFVILIMLYILFEELIWNTAVAPLIRSLSAFHFYRRFLDYIQMRAGRTTVLILFTVPFFIGEVIGILSGILAAKLYLVSAILLYACKIPLIVVALAILQNGKEKLLSIRWFALTYGWVTHQLEKLHSSSLYLQTINLIRHVRQRITSRSGRTKRLIVYLYYRIRRNIK